MRQQTHSGFVLVQFLLHTQSSGRIQESNLTNRHRHDRHMAQKHFVPTNSSSLTQRHSFSVYFKSSWNMAPETTVTSDTSMMFYSKLKHRPLASSSSARRQSGPAT